MIKIIYNTLLLIIIINLILHQLKINSVLRTVPKKSMAPYDESIEIPHVEPEKNIPKNIYRTLANLENIDLFKGARDITQKNNPDYQQIYYDDNDCEKFIKDNFSERIYNAYNSIEPVFGPAKADLFRYLIIYLKGGVYLDIKSAAIKNIDKYITKNDGKINASRAFTYPWGAAPISHIDSLAMSYYVNSSYGEFQNWYIAAPAGNILIKKTIIQAVSNIEYGLKNKNLYNLSKTSIVFLTGPVLYSYIIVKNKEKCNIYNPNLDQSLVYSYEKNHQDKFSKKHYSKLPNINVLKLT